MLAKKHCYSTISTMQFTLELDTNTAETTVLFETAAELERAHFLSGRLAKTLFYFGLVEHTVDTVPVPGAVADEDGNVLPSRTKEPIKNTRLLGAADRLLKISLRQPFESGPAEDIRLADRSFASQIYSYLSHPDCPASINNPRNTSGSFFEPGYLQSLPPSPLE